MRQIQLHCCVQYILFLAALVIFPLRASNIMDASKLSKMVQEALHLHKAGEFDSALVLYKATLPHISGAIASTVNSNIGAIYLNIVGEYV